LSAVNGVFGAVANSLELERERIVAAEKGGEILCFKASAFGPSNENYTPKFQVRRFN
jgi:hypothetical protein